MEQFIKGLSDKKTYNETIDYLLKRIAISCGKNIEELKPQIDEIIDLSDQSAKLEKFKIFISNVMGSDPMPIIKMIEEMSETYEVNNEILKIVEEINDNNDEINEKNYCIGVRLNNSIEGKWDGAQIFISKNKESTCMNALFIDNRDYISHEILNKIKVKEIICDSLNTNYKMMSLEDIKKVSGIQNSTLWDVNK